MITIAWYNVVAIAISIIAIICTRLIPKEQSGIGGGIGALFGFLIWVIVFVLFFVIWGGIFWW